MSAAALPRLCLCQCSCEGYFCLLLPPCVVSACFHFTCDPNLYPTLSAPPPQTGAGAQRGGGRAAAAAPRHPPARQRRHAADPHRAGQSALQHGVQAQVGMRVCWEGGGVRVCCERGCDAAAALSASPPLAVWERILARQSNLLSPTHPHSHSPINHRPNWRVIWNYLGGLMEPHTNLVITYT